MAYFGAIIKYPKQAEIIRKWFEVQPKVTVITGYRRTGKTQLAVFLGTCWLLGKCNHEWPGCKAMKINTSFEWKKKHGRRVGLIGGRSMDHIENTILDQYRSLIPPSYIDQWFSKGKHSISINQRSRFVIRSFDQDLDEWKSGAYELIHLDEEPPLNKLTECLERTRTTKGKIIISVAVDDADVSYLPDACANPKKFFGTDSFMHFKLGVEDIPDEIYPREEKEMVFRQYDGTPFENAVRKGEFAYASGKWWKNFSPQIHVIPYFKPPQDWKRYRGIDPGYSAPTACAWAALHPSNILFVYREYYEKEKTIAERCKDIISLSGNERGRENGMWVERETSEKYEMTLMDHAEFHKDSITGDGLDFEYLKEGINAQPWTTLGQEARREIIAKWLFVDKREKHFVTHEPGAPRIYIMDNCPNLAWEAQRKVVKRASSERSAVSERKIQNNSDHLLDVVEGIVCDLSYMVDDRELV